MFRKLVFVWMAVAASAQETGPLAGLSTLRDVESKRRLQFGPHRR
jgi:hypothetical protein